MMGEETGCRSSLGFLRRKTKHNLRSGIWKAGYAFLRVLAA
jgi:hypothetical protein